MAEVLANSWLSTTCTGAGLSVALIPLCRVPVDDDFLQAAVIGSGGIGCGIRSHYGIGRQEPG